MINFQKLKIPAIILSVVLVFTFVVIWQLKHPDNKNPLPSQSPAFSFNAVSPMQYDQPMTITAGNFSLSFFPLAASASTQSVADNSIRYIDAYPYTDVIQTKSYSKIKEEMILKQPGHPLEFKYQIDISNYDWQFDDSKNLTFYLKGKAGDELAKLFTIPAPFLIDTKNVKSFDAVKMEMTNDGVLTFILNKDWLDKALYPIILDPTVEINIINVHSHPQQGDNWTVNFTTQGQADLKIIPNDQATIDDDEFVSLSCDGQNVQPQILSGDIIFYPNWNCLGTGQVVHYTKTAGNHTLRFEFGDQVAYAYNSTASGPRSPGTAVNDNSYGQGAWTDPEYVVSDDSQYATIVLAGATSNYIKATNFGFSIPAAATINGIVVEVKKIETPIDGEMFDDVIKLVKGGTVQGNNKSTGASWPTSEQYSSYGGTSDLWGLGWISDDINSSNFGVVVAGAGTGSMGGVMASVNHIRITVYYTGGSYIKTVSNAPRGTGVSNSGLVGYWSFDGANTNWTSASGGTTADLSGNNNTGTMTSMNRSTSPVPGISGQAFSFAGSSNMVQDASIDLRGTKAVSVSFWMYEPTSFDNEGVFFEHAADVSDDTGFLFSGGNNKNCTSPREFEVVASDSGAAWDDKCYAFSSVKTWHHYAIIYDTNQTGDDEIKFYIDGILKTRTDWPYNDELTNNFDIASFTIGDQADGTFNSNAIIDEFRLYSRALSPSEIKNLYQAGASRMQANTSPAVSVSSGKSELFGYWSFDGNNTNWTSATGGTTADLSGNNNNGTMTSMSRTSSPVPGISGQALKFNGTSDVDMGDVDALDGLQKITVSSWIKANVNGAAASETHFVDKSACNGTVGDGPFEMEGGSSGTHKADFLIYKNGGSPTTYNSGASVTSIDDTKWHFLTGVYDGANVQIYVDGTMEHQTPASSITMSSTNNDLDIGGYCMGHGGDFSNFVIDEVRVYSRGLSASEVQQLYQIGLRRVKPTN
jgi:hypothetical protein